MAEERKGATPPPVDPELDDWMSAIDEWDANLDLPVAGKENAAAQQKSPAPAPAAPPASASAPVAKPPAVAPPAAAPPAPAAAPAAPVAAKPAAAPAPPPAVTGEDEPEPLHAAPSPALPGDDPLMRLFDGDMELPEEAGEALGSLLGGDAPPLTSAPDPASIDEAMSDEELEASFNDFAPGEQSTRVAEADEVSKLLSDVDQLAAVTPAPAAPPSLGDDEPRAVAIDPGFEVEESTRVAGAEEVSKLLADEP